MKDCPGCGSNLFLKIKVDQKKDPSLYIGSFHVECECGWKGPSEETKKEAEENWNERSK